MLVLSFHGKASKLWEELELLAKVAGKLTLGELLRLKRMAGRN